MWVYLVRAACSSLIGNEILLNLITSTKMKQGSGSKVEVDKRVVTIDINRLVEIFQDYKENEKGLRKKIKSYLSDCNEGKIDLIINQIKSPILSKFYLEDYAGLNSPILSKFYLEDYAGLSKIAITQLLDLVQKDSTLQLNLKNEYHLTEYAPDSSMCPLFFLIKEGNQDLAIAIIKSTSVKNILAVKTSGRKNNIFHFCAEYNSESVAKTLIEDKDWKEEAIELSDTPNSLGETPLHLAAIFSKENDKVAEILLKYGASLTKTLPTTHDHLEFKGCTALHLAALKGNTAVAKLLIDKCSKEKDPKNNSDINIRTKVGDKTALSIALEKGKIEIIDYLLQQDGLDITGNKELLKNFSTNEKAQKVTDFFNKTNTLFKKGLIAVKAAEAAEALRQRNPDQESLHNKQQINKLQTKHKDLEKEFKEAEKEYISHRRESIELVKLLKDDSLVFGLFKSAIDRDDSVALGEFYKHGLDINCRDENGYTPIYYAANQPVKKDLSSSNVIRNLKSFGAEIDIRINEDGKETSIIRSIISKEKTRNNVIKNLMIYGVDPRQLIDMAIEEDLTLKEINFIAEQQLTFNYQDYIVRELQRVRSRKFEDHIKSGPIASELKECALDDVEAITSILQKSLGFPESICEKLVENGFNYKSTQNFDEFQDIFYKKSGLQLVPCNYESPSPTVTPTTKSPLNTPNNQQRRP